MNFNRNEYNKVYHAKQYDRFTLTFPKGIREQIEQAAKAQSKSVNKFIADCVLSAINPSSTATAKDFDLDGMASFLSGGGVGFEYRPTKPKPKEYVSYISGDCFDDEDEPLPF